MIQDTLDINSVDIRTGKIKNKDMNGILFIMSSTCPHCVKIENEFIKLYNTYSRNISVEKIGPENNKKMINQLRVSGYPTILLIKKGVITDKEFKGKRTLDNFINFVLSN